MRKCKYLTILLLLLSLSSCRDETDFEWETQAMERPLQAAVMEARNFFEEYVEYVDLSDEMQGFYPGNFAPDWSKAVVTTDGSHTSVNIPILSEVVYEGSFASHYDPKAGPSQEAYHTAIGQKMIVVKDLTTNAFGCYIVTIIPDEKNATKSNDKAAGMYNIGDRSSTFSGTAYFFMLGGNNYSVAAGRYQNGERYAAASWWWDTKGDAEQLGEEINALMGIKQVNARKRTMGKIETIDYGLISGGGITVSAPPNNAPAFYTGPSMNSGWNSPNTSGSGGGSNGSGGSSSASLPNYGSPTIDNQTCAAYPRNYSANKAGNVLVDNVKTTAPKQTVNTCVTAIMEYINHLFGGNLNEGVYVMRLWQSGINIFNPETDIDGKIVQAFTPQFFTTTSFTSFRTAIDAGHVVMTTIPTDEVGTGHNVLVVGYNSVSGDLIYMDTEWGILREVQPSYFNLSNDYKIAITGIR